MMSTRPNDGQDLETLENAIREHLTPEGLTAIIAFLQPASSYRAVNDDAWMALREVEWFSAMLRQMVGTAEVNRLMNDLGL